MLVIVCILEEVLVVKVNKLIFFFNFLVLEKIEKFGMKKILVIGVGC